MTDERKILEMLSSGQLTVDEATKLLEALKESKPAAPPPPPPPQTPRGIAKNIRVRVKNESNDGKKDADVDVVIPIGLAKFASKFIPAPAKILIEKQGIDVNELLRNINQVSPETQVIRLNEDDPKQATIIIEVM